VTTTADMTRVSAERLRHLQAVLFDLDGTLIDTIELIRLSFRHATCAVLGYEVPDEITMAQVGRPLINQFAEMAPGRGEELLRAYREFNMAHHDEMAKAYPGTIEALTALRAQSIPMGVVTSKGTVAATRGIDLFGLGPFLQVVVTADDVEIHKPDPYPLRFAAGLMGVELEYCMYVGDSPHDMQAAITGGAIAVAALWGAFPQEEVVVPGTSYALAGIDELPRLLKGLRDTSID
jgi:pyrophosphatase PpaX